MRHGMFILHRHTVVVAMLALQLFLAGGASAQRAVVALGPCSSMLYTFNPATGAFSLPKPLKFNTGVTPAGFVGIARTSSGLLYGLSNNCNNWGQAYMSRLFTIDPNTGNLALGQQLSLNNQFFGIIEGDIAWDITSSVLYMYSGNVLYTVNPANGVLSAKGMFTPAAGQSIQAMAFHNTGTLYVLDTGNARLLRINKMTGQTVAALPIPLSVCSSPISGMTFWANNLFINNQARMYSISFNGPVANATSVTTSVVGANTGNVTGLAW